MAVRKTIHVKAEMPTMWAHSAACNFQSKEGFDDRFTEYNEHRMTVEVRQLA